MGIPITGEFEPSDLAHGFDLYDAQDIKASNINAVLTLIGGGQIKGGSHASDPPGDITVQNKTTTGAPTHTTDEGTLCWNSIDHTLYVSQGGGTWTLIGAGGGASQLSDLSDVTSATQTDKFVLTSDGAAYFGKQLVHADIGSLGTDDHHAQSHSVASHSDTTATGTELETLTDGSDAADIHIHDARYFTEAEHLNTSAGAGDAGKPIKLDAGGHVDATMINDGDVSHDSLADVSADDHHPQAHAGDHVDGTDDIQDATAGQKGVATAAQITKLDGIEALADVTDAANVAGAGAVMDSDFSDAEGFMRKTGAGAYTVHKSNLAAAVAPDADNDTTEGYTVGSVWIDTTADKTYICVDNTDTAAVWNDLTAGGGAPGGADTQIQYNNGGAFGGIAAFTWDDTDLLATGTTKLQFTDALAYIHATASAALKVYADTLLTLGKAGTTEFGDGTLRVVRPDTDLKIDLGDVTHYFNVAYIKVVQSLAGSGTATYLHGGVIDVNTTAVGNIGVGEDDLMAYTIPADTLATNGDSLEVVCGGIFAATANVKRIKLYLDGVPFVTTGLVAQNGGSWRIDATFIRTGASAVDVVASIITKDGATIPIETTYTASAATDTTGAMILKCTGQAIANDDIVQEIMRTICHPAP